MVQERRPQVIDYSEESQAERFARKSKEAPYVPIGNLCSHVLACTVLLTFVLSPGLAGCIGAVIYGAYQFKNKGEMSTSVYLMKFRVVAQAAVVVTLGVGVGYSMIDKYVLPKFQTEAHKKEGGTAPA